MLEVKRDYTATFNGKTYEGNAGDGVEGLPEALVAALKAAHIVEEASVDEAPVEEVPVKKGKSND